MVAKAAKRKVRVGNQLRFSIPADVERLEDYIKKGLLTPNRLDDDKEDFSPLDFTSISSREVGRQHSAWAVRQAHLIFLIGNLRAEIGNARHELKNAESEWLIQHSGEFKTKWEAEYAVGRRSKRVKRLREKLSRGESSLSRYEALSESYKVLREAASREMSRRADERASKD